MKKPLLLLTLLAATTVAQAVDTAYTAPVGGTQITFSQGSRFTGMSFLNSAIARGTVTNTSGSLLTVSAGVTNFGSLLTSTSAYYVELVAGPTSTYVGDRFEVDVAGTIASANGTVSINLASPNNTMGSLPSTSDLNSYTAVLRPHVTLGQLFGTKTNQLMQGSTVVSTADQVLLLNSQTQAFETYYFLKNGSGTVAQWAKVGGGSTNQDNTVIAPGVGMVVVRNTSTPVTLTWSGEIRLNQFAQPLVAGNNLVCQPTPIDASPASRSMTVANGMTGSTSSTTADKIQFPVAGVFKTYYLLRNASGTVEQWTLVGGGSTPQNTAMLFPSNGAVIINKISADANNLVPYTLSL